MYFKNFLLLGLLFFFNACADDVRGKLEAPKNAFGQANKLCVVADNDIWDGDVGDTLRYYFASAYPILPQPEPFFDIQHFTPQELNADPYRKELRAYLMVGNVNDVESASTKMITKDIGSEKIRRSKEDKSYNITVGRDKWAQGQILVYLFANSHEELMDAIRANFPAISKRYNEADQKQFDATIYFGGENEELRGKLNSKLGVDMRIPSDYFLAIENEDVIWMRKETEFLSSNIMVHKVKYTDQSQLTKAGIKAIRDELGKKYVSTEIEDTWMRTNDVDLPMLTQAVTISGNYALEARGIWDIVNDFMGGPFISYLILNEKKGELLYIDCFVHAPGKKKRDFIQHLEYIIGFTKF